MPTALTTAHAFDTVEPADVSLLESQFGYQIQVADERAGVIEGRPGYAEYIAVTIHWQGKGVARAALKRFIAVSRLTGCSDVTTTNAAHPAMEHILQTEGFDPRSETSGWIKQL